MRASGGASGPETLSPAMGRLSSCQLRQRSGAAAGQKRGGQGPETRPRPPPYSCRSYAEKGRATLGGPRASCSDFAPSAQPPWLPSPQAPHAAPKTASSQKVCARPIAISSRPTLVGARRSAPEPLDCACMPGSTRPRGARMRIAPVLHVLVQPPGLARRSRQRSRNSVTPCACAHVTADASPRSARRQCEARAP